MLQNPKTPHTAICLMDGRIFGKEMCDWTHLTRRASRFSFSLLLLALSHQAGEPRWGRFPSLSTVPGLLKRQSPGTGIDVWVKFWIRSIPLNTSVTSFSEIQISVQYPFPAACSPKKVVLFFPGRFNTVSEDYPIHIQNKRPDGLVPILCCQR